MGAGPPVVVVGAVVGTVVVARVVVDGGGAWTQYELPTLIPLQSSLTDGFCGVDC